MGDRASSRDDGDSISDGTSDNADSECESIELGPFAPNTNRIAAIRSWLEEDFPDNSTSSYRLFVGNDPLVGWLGDQLAGGVAFAHGELVCLKRSGRRRRAWRAAWTIAPRDDQQLAPIHEKIRSKMSTAGSLGTVITGLLVFLLQDGINRASWWSWLSLAAFVGSAILYFVTLFFCDSLSMPARFWQSRRSTRGVQGASTQGDRSEPWRRLRHGRRALQRPPTSTARVLQESMVHVWTRLFLPATALAGIGVALLIGEQAWPPPHDAEPLKPGVAGLVLTGSYVIALIIYSAAHRPDLGASD